VFYIEAVIYYRTWTYSQWRTITSAHKERESEALGSKGKDEITLTDDCIKVTMA